MIALNGGENAEILLDPAQQRRGRPGEGERSRQERPTQDGELPEEPSCVAEARSMGRSLFVHADGEHRDDSQ